MTKVTQLSLDGEGDGRRIHLREICGDSDTPLETVGQDLRTARLRRGEDLATVSRALKIRKEHLEAVEEDRIENLPGKTYALGFVRTYAAYLGLDVNVMVQRFKEEISGRHDDDAPSVSPVPDDEMRRLPGGWRIVAGLVVLLLGYGAWHLLSNGPAQEAVPPAPSLNPPKTMAAKPPALPVTQTAAAVQPSSMSAAAPATPAAAPAQPVSPPAKTAQAKPSEPQAAHEPAVPADGKVYGELNKGARVVLKADGDTRITVKGGDGTTYLNRDLKAGDSYMVPNLPGLYFATSNAGALNVALDGQVLGRVGENQEVLGRVSLDPLSLVDRFDAR